MIALLKSFISIERKKLLIISIVVVIGVVLDLVLLLGWQVRSIVKVSASASKIKAGIETFNKDFSAQEKLKTLNTQDIKQG